MQGAASPVGAFTVSGWENGSAALVALKSSRQLTDDGNRFGNGSASARPNFFDPGFYAAISDAACRQKIDIGFLGVAVKKGVQVSTGTQEL